MDKNIESLQREIELLREIINLKDQLAMKDRPVIEQVPVFIPLTVPFPVTPQPWPNYPRPYVGDWPIGQTIITC